MKLIWSVWISVLIIHLTYGQSSAEKATWKDFQNSHVIATVQGSAANWNTLLRNRIHSQYGTKGLNTFVVNAASVIGNNFPPTVPQYTGGSATNLFWSATTQHIFVLTLSGSPGKSGSYIVYDCGQKYYVAGLDMKTRQPIHYQGHASTQGPRLDPIIAGCSKVHTKTPTVQLI